MRRRRLANDSIVWLLRNFLETMRCDFRYLRFQVRKVPLHVLLWTAWTISAAPPAAIYPNPSHQISNAPTCLTLTWSPGDYELIVNGSFETGSFTGWQRLNSSEFGGGINNTYINNGTYRPQSGDGPFPPFAGSFGSVTDENAPGVLTLYQDITLPATADAITLSWADQIHNLANTFANTPPLQEFRAEIRNTNNAVLATVYRTEAGEPVYNNWVKRGVDLSGHRGQRIRVAFVTEVNLAPFHTHLDNISVRVISRPDFAYDVYFGTNAVLGTNEFLGSTTSASWALPRLQPQQTYYWRVVTRQEGEQVIGPTWRFTTRPIGPVDQFVWSAIASPQSPGVPISVTLTAVDATRNVVTNFNGSVSLSGGAVVETTSHSVLGDVSPTALAGYDRSTVGYAFTPSADIQVTHVRHFSGEKVSIWTDHGILLTSRAVTNQPNVWSETPLVQPVRLLAGRRYRLGVYTAGAATHYARFDAPASFSHAVLHQSYDGLGDVFPTNAHPARWWLVDLKYAIETLQSTSLLPGTVTNFTNGVWSGHVSIASSADSFSLRADDALGHVGLAELFSVVSQDTDGDGMPDHWEQTHALRPDDPNDAAMDADADGASNLNEYRAGTDPKDAASTLRITRIEASESGVRISFRTVSGKRYRLERAASLSAPVWETLGESFSGNGSVMQASDSSMRSQQRFYRCRVLP
jgi:hypothetical protein